MGHQRRNKRGINCSSKREGYKHKKSKVYRGLRKKKAKLGFPQVIAEGRPKIQRKNRKGEDK